jgi:TolB-like protein
MKSTMVRSAFVWCAIFIAAGSSLPEEQKANFAVITLKNGEGVSGGEAEIITDRLRTELFRTGRVSMMERDQMQEILNEQGFQQSGVCTDEACMVEMGQLLGVQRIVSGSVGRLGSMFLVNIRAIDVETAKIISVVSVDIRGGIEDLVEQLPGIAKQLTGESPSTAAPVTKDSPKPEKAPEKKKEPEPEPQKQEAPKTVVDGADRKDRNANRHGIRLSYILMLGTPVHYIDGEEVDIESTWMSTTRLPLMGGQIKGMIKAGRFVTIDVGGGLLVGMEDFTDTDIDEWGSVRGSKFVYFDPTFALGANFVMRFFPLKINIGPQLDFNLPLEFWKTYVDDYYTSDGDSTTADIQTNLGFFVSFGARAGIELLAGKNAGLSFDFILRPFHYEVEWEIEDPDTYDYYYFTHEVEFPLFGMAASVNFYF